MYCHLCQTEGSINHDNSSGHRAAKEIAAIALDRLNNYLSVGGESKEDSINVSSGPEKEKSVKTPEAVSYCDICNTAYPINGHSAHFRMKTHAISLISEQDFEELVFAYTAEEPKSETPSEASDDGAYVDESEVVNKYTCHICALEVPRVFRAEHERGSRHRAARTFALAAARRARDTLASKSDDGSGDKNKFSGKMMRKLLKLYVGNYEEENAEAEPESKSEPDTQKLEPRLTPKEYFTNIQPYIPYIGTFTTLYIDDTEYVTLKIGNEILKIHVNNLNGLFNVKGKDGYYMNCRMCDGSSNFFGSNGQRDNKSHVMSLGHIKNVLSPIDNVHLIRRIDEVTSVCALCNVHISANVYGIENHIFKDARHTTALLEALERGKNFKENKNHMKIMIYVPPAPKSSGFKHNEPPKWFFGHPKQHFGSPFGAQTGFGGANAHNFGFSGSNGIGGFQNNFGANSTQNTTQTPSAFGSVQGTLNSLFGASSTQNNVGSAPSFGVQNTGFGGASTQNNGFGSASTQNTGFGNPSVQNNGFGSASTQNTGFGSASTQNTGFGSASTQNTGFGSASTQNTGFGSASTQHSVFGSTNTRSTLFANAQNTFGSASKPSAFGTTQNTNSFGNTQNNSTVDALQNKTKSDTVQNNSIFCGGPKKAANVDAAHNNSSGLTPQNKPGFNVKFDFPVNTTIVTGFPFFDLQNNTTVSNSPQNINIESEKKDGADQSKNLSFTSSPNNLFSVKNDTKNIASNQDNAQDKILKKTANDGNKNKTNQRLKRSPPRKLNYSSSSSSDSDYL